MKIIKIALIGCLSLMSASLSAQALKAIEVIITDNKGLQVKNFNRFQQPGYDMPLISLHLNGKFYSSLNAKKINENRVILDGKLIISIDKIEPLKSGGFLIQTMFQNTSSDTLTVSKIVPFGESDKHVYLTSGDKGDRLSRSFIYRPGYSPANVTLPDNSWGLGLGIVNVDNGSSVVAITKINRETSTNISPRRFETVIYPGGKLISNIWMDSYIGRWQEGFRLMFQKNMLYDIEPEMFDNSMYEREDLKWVKYGFVGHFTSAWHNFFYDGEKQVYSHNAFTEKLKRYYGGDDFMILWTGFPVLGLDQRNQWDLIRSLPGGVKKVKEISDNGLKDGMHLMTNYKPWDLPAAYDQIYNSTAYENPIDGLGRISKDAGFWGVMFDTRSESAKWFQDGMDKNKEGFAIFPEGMSVPADMQNCVIGRTHAAIEYAPFLNLNKLIKPDFCIYRQAAVEKENLRRDVALSFFNGHGVEFHQYMNPELDWVNELYTFTGKTVRILRENADNFFAYDWTPLLPTTIDSVYVNEFPLEDKTIYTIYSLRHEGYKGQLFEVPVEEGWHYVDLWNNTKLKPKRLGSKFLIEADLKSFPKEYLGTRTEAEVSAIGRFRELITIDKQSGIFSIDAPAGKEIKIWQGTPKYGKNPVWSGVSGKIRLTESELRKGDFNGNLIVQLFEKNTLQDQRIVEGSSIEEVDVTNDLFTKSDGKSSYSGSYMDVNLMREKDLLNIVQKQDAEIVIYPKDLGTHPKKVSTERNLTIKIMDAFGCYEGDLVILAKQNGKVVDSTSVFMPYGYPRIASTVVVKAKASSTPEGMVYVPAGNFKFNAKHIGDWMIKHPVEDTAKIFNMESFYIDKHPVTNIQFKKFLDETKYKPTDAENFLKHWDDEIIASGEENNPVTFVSYEDAKAYADWTGKRLPTEKEWQYAAQGEKGLLYPWGEKLDSTKCNVGNGILDPVGKYPQGANSLGIEELTGSVWQMTHDWYKNASSSFIILKGGSYFTPRSSWWYVTGGALPLVNRQQWLRVSQGYERNATVGFRLVKDADK